VSSDKCELSNVKTKTIKTGQISDVHLELIRDFIIFLAPSFTFYLLISNFQNFPKEINEPTSRCSLRIQGTNAVPNFDLILDFFLFLGWSDLHERHFRNF
jgi:hypothetical protein